MAQAECDYLTTLKSFGTCWRAHEGAHVQRSSLKTMCEPDFLRESVLFTGLYPAFTVMVRTEKSHPIRRT